MKNLVILLTCFFAMASQAQIHLGKYDLEENTVVEFNVDLSPTVRAQFVQLGQTTVVVARVGIYLPKGFLTNASNHMVVINSTSDGKASSIGSLRSFGPYFQTNNCLGIAADGPGGKIPGDPTAWRYGLEKTAVDYVRTNWPRSSRWPIVCAGFSGGAKWSPLIAGLFFRDKYPLSGIFMGGCNEDRVTVAKKQYGLSSEFLNIPIFLSGGDTDPVATPDQQWGVYDSMKKSGFTKIRFQTHPGGHTLGKGQFDQALAWFTSGAANIPPLPPRAAVAPSTNELKFPKTIRSK